MDGVNRLVRILGDLNHRLSREHAQKGVFQVSLLWNDPSDLDLHVTCPCNTHINYSRTACTSCRGQLDVDMNRHDDEIAHDPVENIFWHDYPPLGHYKIWVQNYKTRNQPDRSIPFSCVVTYQQFSWIFSGEVNNRQQVTVFDTTLEELLSTPNQSPSLNLTGSPEYDPSMPPMAMEISLPRPEARPDGELDQQTNLSLVQDPSAYYESHQTWGHMPEL
jgi:hypothetical protein